MSLIVRQPRNLHQREGAGLGGEEEVGGHRVAVSGSYEPNMMHTCMALSTANRNGYDDVRIVNARMRRWHETDWQAEVKGMLKAEIKRRNMTYEQLADEAGRDRRAARRPTTSANKISRGGFSAVFFVQCLRAIGCDVLRLSNA